MIVIKNQGKSVAKNVRMYINDEDAQKNPYVDGTFPIEHIGSNGEVELLFAKYVRMSFPWTVKLVWDDDFEENREYITSING